MDTDFKDIKKQYNELKALWGTKKSRNLSNEEALRYQDVLELLQERGYIIMIPLQSCSMTRSSTKRFRTLWPQSCIRHCAKTRNNAIYRLIVRWGGIFLKKL